MKKIIIYGLIIFVFSFGVGYYYSKLWKKENIVKLEETKVLNETVVETTAPIEEKVSFDASFVLKKYYNECGHIHVNHAELPSEFINLTQKEIEENLAENIDAVIVSTAIKDSNPELVKAKEELYTNELV